MPTIVPVLFLAVHACAAAPPVRDEDMSALQHRTHVSVIEAPVVDDAIVAAAERHDVDVIAVGSHGRSGLSRTLIGSVAEQVARRSRRPVFIVHGGPGGT